MQIEPNKGFWHPDAVVVVVLVVAAEEVVTAVVVTTVVEGQVGTLVG